MEIVLLLDVFLNPGFNMTVCFSMLLELYLAQVTSYTRKDFELQEIKSLHRKLFLILNKVKTSLNLSFFGIFLQRSKSFI